MKSSDGPLDNQTWSKSSLPQQKLPKSLYSHNCTLANGSQSSTIFQVWLFSGPEFFTLAILCMIVKLGIGSMYSGYHLWGYTRGSQYHTTQSHICISVYSSTPEVSSVMPASFGELYWTRNDPRTWNDPKALPKWFHIVQGMHLHFIKKKNSQIE